MSKCPYITDSRSPDNYRDEEIKVTVHYMKDEVIEDFKSVWITVEEGATDEMLRIEAASELGIDEQNIIEIIK